MREDREGKRDNTGGMTEMREVGGEGEEMRDEQRGRTCEGGGRREEEG